MIEIATLSSPKAHRGPAPEPVRIWGLDLRALHDRFWRTQGVEVVRRGLRDHPSIENEVLFLLLEPDDLVVAELPVELQRRVRRRAVAYRVLVEEAGPAYDERLVVDSRGRLVDICRDYEPPARRSTTVVVTTDSRHASSWAHAPSTGAAWQTLRGRPDRGMPTARCTGVVARETTRTEQDRCLAGLLQRWGKVGAVCPDVRSSGSGLWAHETARIPTDARLVPPLWIDAGVQLEAGEVVIGPGLVTRCGERIVHRPVSIDEQTSSTTVERGRQPGKRGFDLLVSVLLLVLMMPLMAIIALVIRLEDGGPVVFAHPRQKRGGATFKCYKFRTMCRNADGLRTEYIGHDHADGPQFHIPDDPRLLRCGRVLRRFHLDELPQLWNVLVGDMSLVGPRPSPDSENQYCPAWRETRLSVRPGLTGLWQVSRTRAPQIDFQEWIRYDLEYVRRWSWSLDLRILLRTIVAVLRDR